MSPASAPAWPEERRSTFTMHAGQMQQRDLAPYGTASMDLRKRAWGPPTSTTMIYAASCEVSHTASPVRDWR